MIGEIQKAAGTIDLLEADLTGEIIGAAAR